MGGTIRFQIVLRTVVAVILLGSLLAGVQSVGPFVGIERSSGLWIWAAAASALVLALFLPLLQRAGAPPGRVAIFAAAMLVLGAGAYLYVAWVLLPEAAARAAGASGAANSPTAPRK